MSLVKRIFVEKKKDYDIEGLRLFNEFKQLIGVQNLLSVRVVNRYDIEGIKDEDYIKAKNTIFSEPPIDKLYDDELLIEDDEYIFSYEYLPGQYDQRADSTSQCISLISETEKVIIKTAKVIILKGNISISDIDKIVKYVINPVEARKAQLEKPYTLKIDLDIPTEVKILDNFTNMDNEQRKSFMLNMGLAMNVEDIKYIQKYFKNTEKRNPTVTEIKVLDTYWSDHCRHTTFLSQIDNIEIDQSKYLENCKIAYNEYLEGRKLVYEGKKDKPICLMDIALLAMKELKKKGILDNVEKTDEINACSIVIKADINDIEEEWLIMFKNETHNHPTEIEPYGGAATCLGGAIRDPLSGRAYVYQAMRVTGCGNPTNSISETLEGKLPQIKISRGAALGYSSYGNQIGLATGQVEEIYDDNFVAKRMEIGAVIAGVPRKNVFRGKSLPGDIIVLLGGRTGRDGCGGATGSSKEHDEESLITCGAEVQKGNPPTERKIQRLFRNEKASKLIKVCNDFGAGGVSVAIGELASGLIINLNSVLKKYEGLDGTELAISESQERMAVVIEPKDFDEFIKYAKEENLEAYKVADVTKENRLVLKWNNKKIVDIDRDFLDTNGVTQHVNARVVAPSNNTFFDNTKKTGSIKEQLINILTSLESCSRKGLVEQFDSSIGGASVLMPFGGKKQLTPQEGMVAKIPTLEKTDTATIMTFGYNPKIGKWSPFHGAMYAILESVSKVVALGGKVSSIRLTFQEYFERLYGDEKKWGKPLSALLGAYYAQKRFEIAAIGGKDSMSGTFKDIDVPPTLVSFAVDVSKASKVISAEFKEQVANVILVKIPVDDTYTPDFIETKKIYNKFSKLVEDKKVLAAATVKGNGILECIAKMSFGNNVGFLSNNLIRKEDWFSPNYGYIVAQVIDDTCFDIIGNTVLKGIITIDNEVMHIDELIANWELKLEKVFPTKDIMTKSNIITSTYINKDVTITPKGIGKPSIFIPVFPGTNCEYDVKKAFNDAGGNSIIDVFNNLTPKDIHLSVETIVKNINKSQIIMLPGGFSAGDEPDGSGKFIATVFRNPYIKEAVLDLLNNRDGLILGICNGFQALIKLGLVPYGTIIDMQDNSPTLTFNKIGRHVSCMVNTKIVSNKSPWLSEVNVSDIHKIPVSHGEGRFVASESIIKNLFTNGQVATQYVDFNGTPTYNIAHNPNGSFHAIEGITSMDGRVFGKMGHSERIGENILKNIPGIKDQKIFSAGVKYFK